MGRVGRRGWQGNMRRTGEELIGEGEIRGKFSPIVLRDRRP